MLCSFVKLARNPVTALESHPCTRNNSNSLRITSLRKNPQGEGPVFRHSRSELRALCDLCGETLSRSKPDRRFYVPSRVHRQASDWIHHTSTKMQQSPRESPVAATLRRQPLTVVTTLRRHLSPPRLSPVAATLHRQPFAARNPHFHPTVIPKEVRDLLFSSAASPRLPPLGNPQLTHRASFPILLVQMISRIHRHHHHHGTAPRLMRCV